VLNRTRQFLEVSLPKGSELEAVRVDSASVKPGLRVSPSGERILVPLARMQPGDVSSEVVIFWSRRLAGARGGELSDLGTLKLLEPEIYGLEVERTFFTVVVPEGFTYTFDGNMNRIHEAEQKLYRLSKVSEEMERAALVQSLGNEEQVVRANDNIILNTVEKESIVGWLNDASNLATLTLDERKQIKRQLDELEVSKVQKDFVEAPGEARVKLEEQNRNLKQVAEMKKAQEYIYGGKSNVAAQQWGANLRAETRHAATTEQRRLDAQQTELRNKWRDAFDQVGQAALPQRALPANTERAPNLGGGGGGAGRGFYGYTGGGAGGGGTREIAGATITYAPDLTFGRRPIAPSQRRAGLLSLPVTIPERGEVYRFEKLNGGARLELSAAAKSTGHGFRSLMIFVALAAALLLVRRLRKNSV
jgi:hypothetical protein